MSFSSGDGLLLAGLLAAGVLLLSIAQFVRIPYPILLVLGGLALAFIPGVPQIQLRPEIVLVAVLPPLLYGSAYFTSLRELRANWRPIGALAIGLVLMTMVAVAGVAHEVIGLDWPTAFVLGAIVSPTDPTAATSIARRLGVPRRLIAVIEGESLVNDGTALVAYRFAVVAVVTGSFSLANATGRFFVNVIGGIAIGLAVGYLIRQLRRRLDNPPVEITRRAPHRLLRLPARAGGRRLGRARGGHGRRLHGLVHAGADDAADATAGPGRLGDRLLPPERPAVRAGRAAAAGHPRLPLGRSTGTLLGWAALVCLVVIGARFVWVFALACRRALVAQGAAARPGALVGPEDDPRLVGHARRRLARRRAGAAADHATPARTSPTAS